MMNLDGEEIVEQQEEEYKTPKISPFDYVNAIHYTKENLCEDEWGEKQYNPYIVNKALSFGPDTAVAANEMNGRSHLDKKLQFSFLINIIRKRKRFNSWIKQEKLEDLGIVKKYYNYNTEKAIQALKILSNNDLKKIKEKMIQGGLINDKIN
jgi:hypothetical protein